jgi:hypothetical protein
VTGRLLEPYDEDPDPLYGDPDGHPTLPQVRSPVSIDSRPTLPSGGAIELGHLVHQSDLLAEIRDLARRQAEAAERSADADVRSVEVLHGCRAVGLGVLAGGSLLVVGGSALLLLWMVLP